MPFDNPEFEAFFRAYYQRIAAFIFRIIGSYDAAEDITTDIFLVLWERREAISDEVHMRKLLFRAARNSSLNYLRNERNREELIERTTPGNENTLHMASWPDLQASVAHDEVDSLVMAILSDMPEQRRSVYSLRWEQELSYNEISKLLGISAKTVEMHVSLALRELRERLRPYLDV